MRLEGIQTRARKAAREKYPNFDNLPRKKRGSIINSFVQAEIKKYPKLKLEIEKRERERQETARQARMMTITREELDSRIESTLTWIEDAEQREDYSESEYYKGKLAAYQEILELEDDQ